jgi:glycosyltransferase involved in cell wall biosynthesis
MKQISVVIPLYNQQGSIGKTLSDLLLQDFEDFEIIVVDDASTDLGAVFAERALSDSKIPWKVLRLRENRGASVARNTGLESASGEAVFFFDADDRMAPDTLGKLWKAMKASQASLAFSGFKVCRENQPGGKAYVFPLPRGESSVPSRAALSAFLGGKRYLNASNTLYDRSFLVSRQILFPRGCRFAEDREFIAKALFHADTVAVVPEPLVTYIQHENQSTSRMARDPSKYAHEVGVYLRLRKYLAKNHAEPALLRLIDSLELPGAVVRMATSAVRSGKEAYFWETVHSRRLRQTAFRGRGAWSLKPEVAVKSMLFFYAPNLLLRLYRRKARSV